MKPTAVEFAVEKLEKFIPSENQLVIRIILEQALEMEKQQIIDAYWEGSSNWDNETEAEQYYNEQFKNK
jgi:hypothetical protein